MRMRVSDDERDAVNRVKRRGRVTVRLRGGGVVMSRMER